MSKASPTHVGALLLFEKPQGRPAVVQEIVEAYRACEPVPPFNLLPDLVGAGLPRFRNWFIDGVPGHRFALYTKVHHAIVDGVSGTKRIYASLNTSAKRGVPLPAFAIEDTVRKPRPPRVLVDRLAELGITATRQTLALRDVSVTALRKGLATLLRAEPTGSMPFTAQRGPMNEPLQMGRSIATLSLPLDEMRAVGKRFDATLNDLAVTLVDEGVHRYLRHSGRAFSHRLVAFCPVSLREAGDARRPGHAAARQRGDLERARRARTDVPQRRAAGRHLPGLGACHVHRVERHPDLLSRPHGFRLRGQQRDLARTTGARAPCR